MNLRPKNQTYPHQTKWRKKNPSYSRNYWRKKPKIVRKAVTKWLSKNKAKTKLYNFRANIKRKGLTLEMYHAMLKLQNGTCAVCKIKPSRKLCIDHNHTTQKPRELLCSQCNTILGLAQEDPNRLIDLSNYLIKHT